MKKCYIFLDGTGSNINSQQEDEIGRDVIAELFINCRAMDVKPFSLDLLDKTMAGLEGNGRDLALEQLADSEAVKAYFPGPGAPKCEFQGQVYETPGIRDRSQFSEKIWRVNALNQMDGSGWLYNMSCALTLCRLLYDQDKQFVFYIFGYSRGAITAISLASHMNREGFPVYYMALIDPVAGGDAARVKNFVDDLYQVEAIVPYNITANVRLCDIFYACTERRAEFDCQLPVFYMQGEYPKAKKPLLIDDAVEAYAHFLYGDHKQVAYRRRKHEGRTCQAAIEVFGIIYSRDDGFKEDALQLQLQGEYYEPDSVSKMFTYQPRVIANLWRSQEGGRFCSVKLSASYQQDVIIVRRLQQKHGVSSAVDEMAVYGDLVSLIDYIKPGVLNWYSSAPFRSDRKGKWLERLKHDIAYDLEGGGCVAYGPIYSINYLRRIAAVALVVRGGGEHTKTGKKLLGALNRVPKYRKYKQMIKKQIYLTKEDLAYEDLLTFTRLDLVVLSQGDMKETVYSGSEYR